MNGPLSGLKVLDMTAVVAGPVATQMLGDLGADVIKVEPPKGDVLRWNGPARNPGMGAIFHHLGRSKRSIVLDLKKSAGHELALRIAKTVDVFVCNNRPQSMARLKLSYEDVAKVNPKIIYCSIYGFGEGGPYAGKAAYDDLVQGVAGLPALVEMQTGTPRYFPLAVTDKLSGIIASHAILAALYHREKTGEGQAVDIPMFETAVAELTLSTHLYGHAFVPPMGDMGYQRLLAGERKPHLTSDGRYICVMPYTDKHWRSFFQMIGQPELASDSRFVDMNARSRNTTALYQCVIDALKTKPLMEWLDMFSSADIPAMPMNTLETLFSDPHLEKVGFFSIKEHPTEGKIRTMPIPSRYSKSQAVVTRLAPRLGEHTREILGAIGIGKEEIDDLLKRGVIAECPQKA